MNTNSSTILVLAGTGKTGSRIAKNLLADAHAVRTGARQGADIRFDWDDTATFAPALDGARAVYLVPPGLSLDFAATVAGFLDAAEEAGVRHVTYLSARGVEQAPPSVALRAVELDLGGRAGLTGTILRPAWFMQNFSESFLLPPILDQNVIPAPAGDGAEAFVDADDIAAAAVASLTQPEAHAGAEYTLTGPEALTFGDAAQIITEVSGRQVTHVDLDPQAWIDASVEAGVPADYAGMLASLFGVIRSGAGATTSDDVERATGQPPRTFRQFAEGAASAWR